MKISQARVAEINEALLAHLAVEKKCPAALDDLIRDRAVDRHSLNDAWGTPIAYRLPAGGAH